MIEVVEYLLLFTLYYHSFIGHTYFSIITDSQQIDSWGIDNALTLYFLQAVPTESPPLLISNHGSTFCQVIFQVPLVAELHATVLAGG